MLRSDKVISPNEKVTKTTDGKLTFDVIKEYLYGNPLHLILSLRDMNIFYNTYYI